jgi:hypothetical protein
MNLNLLEPQVKKELISRIQSLQPGTKPLWGKMNAAQMLAHLSAQIRVALGIDELPFSLAGKLFHRFLKKQVLTENPYGRGLPTAKSFVIRHQPEFEKSRSELIGYIDSFSAPNLTQKPHPYFGPMTPEEWGKGTWKHIDHHLKQFGV